MAILLFITSNCFAQKDSIHINNAIKDSTVYDLVTIQEQPQFPGGDESLMKFLRQNINYPTKERDNGIQGKVYVTFVIDTEGNVTNVELYKGILGGPECNKEAIRVINLMPKWKPGRQNGKAVKVRYIMPINFMLQYGGGRSGVDLQQASYYYNKGVKKSEDGKLEDAVDLFNKALKANPNDIDALYNKGVCCIKINKNKEACEAFQKIKSLGKHDADDLIKKYCSN